MQITLRHPVQCGGEFSHELSYSGGSCGPNNSLIRWTAATTPRGCRLRPRAEGSAAHAQLANVRFNQAIFGSCGVPPGNATAAIPIDICTEAPVPDTGDSPSPTNQPPSPAAPGIEPPTSPPQTPSGAQVPLAPNERVPSGVSRIGAATSGGVLNTLGRPVADQVVVGVVDSGVDGTHPDINVIGGKSWVLAGPTAEDAAASESDALTDPYGHGTHVAGSVAARNNGNGKRNGSAFGSWLSNQKPSACSVHAAWSLHIPVACMLYTGFHTGGTHLTQHSGPCRSACAAGRWITPLTTVTAVLPFATCHLDHSPPCCCCYCCDIVSHHRHSRCITWYSSLLPQSAGCCWSWLSQ